MRGKIDSVAVQSAKLVLVDGMSQTDAARKLNQKTNTVNNGVMRYKNADEAIKKAYSIES
jgi:transposase